MLRSFFIIFLFELLFFPFFVHGIQFLNEAHKGIICDKLFSERFPIRDMCFSNDCKTHLIKKDIKTIGKLLEVPLRQIANNPDNFEKEVWVPDVFGLGMVVRSGPTLYVFMNDRKVRISDEARAFFASKKIASFLKLHRMLKKDPHFLDHSLLSEKEVQDIITELNGRKVSIFHEDY